MFLKQPLKNFIFKENNTILSALKKIDKNHHNFLIIVNTQNKFSGIVTLIDIRKALVKGSKLNDNLSSCINKNPFYFMIDDLKNENNIKVLYNKKSYQIDPKLIPVLDRNQKPCKIIDISKINLIKSKKKPKKILVIGGAGYIGSELTKLLINKKYQVHVYDKFIYQSKKFFEKSINNNKLQITMGDTNEINKLYKIISESYAVIHLAEMVGDPLCDQQLSKTFEVNYLSTSQIANICKLLNIKKFIYISSCSVYGENKGSGLLNEKSNINPISNYAKLKLMAEKSILQNITNEHRPYILRLGTVFGTSLRQRFDLVINLFSGLAATNKKITVNGGDQWRPFVHVNDVCLAIIKILRSNKKNEHIIYNIVGENIKIKDLGTMLKHKYKADVLFSKKSIDRRDYKASSKLAFSVLGFKSKYKVLKSISEIIKYINKKKITNINEKKFINVLNWNKF